MQAWIDKVIALLKGTLGSKAEGYIGKLIAF